jgi:hypothetical protein
MVPFIKTSAEVQAKQAKAITEDAQKMQYFHLPANDDKYNTTYYGAPETKVSNE